MQTKYICRILEIVEFDSEVKNGRPSKGHVPVRSSLNTANTVVTRFLSGTMPQLLYWYIEFAVAAIVAVDAIQLIPDSLSRFSSTDPRWSNSHPNRRE